MFSNTIPLSSSTRNADTWPRHKSKAKRRHLSRKKNARKAQELRDRAALRRNY